ncbi:hypothetical protein ACEPAI_8055 [Sanghuangporus weigelae]
MFSTARRHGFPSTKHQDQQQQQQQKKKKKGKPPAATTTAALSAPPTPSKSKADARTAAQAYAAAAAARPATAAAAVGSFACRPVAHAMTSVSALAAARPMTANGVTTASAQQSLPTSAPSPSPSPSPVSAPSQQGLLRLAMPRASAASACATPSPLSSGLPSPTLPPLPASHFASQPHGVVSSLSGQPAAPATAHVLRSPVINISHPHHGHGGSPLVHHARKLSANANGISKDELVFDYRVRPLPHTRKFSVSSVADSIASGSVKSPKSPNSMSESPSPASQGSGRSSMLREDVLSPGDRVGAGLTLQGEVLHPVFNDNENARRDKEEPATELEVVRRLGAGSYAIVYLVREVLHHPPPDVLDGLNDDNDDDNDIADRSRPGNGRRLSEELELWDVPSELDLDSDPLELDGMRRKKDGDADANKVYYGKEYAVKVLSKVGMDDEALEAQLVEANIHQSLPIHPNIVTLHRALETPSFLLLVLEFVPGEDLYYFLEQARDHYEPEPSSSCSTSSDSEGEEKRHKANTSVLSVNSVNTVGTMSTTRTPPTPSLLSTLNEKQLLGRRRLRLIASMFAQMCEAVAVCHDVGVYHRDIKPENFIVTDGWEEDGERRVVVVKLTDFGLSTRDAASSDMDCGSAPYMSYECRNNCAPTYAPRAADVWSLGIVLINMLYHINPWTDTTQGVCPSFSSFLAAPEHFFRQRFAGMVPAVASFLCQRVFCILPSDDPADSAGRRVSAREFGRWARELPRLMASEEPVGVPLALVNVAVTASAEHKSQSSLAFPFPPKETKEKEVEKEGAVTSLSPTLPLSPTSPPSSALLTQSLAAVLAQQEAAAAAAGSSSPAWRHKRGLSNASVGYALSSVPQSRRPASRQQSFSAERTGVPSSHLGLHGIAGLGSAAGSRAATPLLRGRALGNGNGAGSNAAGMRSRVPSYCETPAGVVGAVSELPTVFDEGEGDLSSGSLGLELQLGRQRELEVERVVEEKGGEERERSRVEELELEQEQEPEQEQEQEHEVEHDAEDESNATMSRSTSMVRRRKRGARRGKGAIIQQQQMEIARLQQQQEELTRQVMRMQEQLAAQQQQEVQPQQQQQAQVQKPETQVRGKSQERNMNLNLQTQAQVQVLASLNPSPTATTASGLLAAPLTPKTLGQVHPHSLPAVPQKPTGDVLDSLASASEALARELSRAKNVRSGGVSAGSPSSAASVSGSVSVSSPLLVPMRAISGAGTRESSPARSSSVSISGPNQHRSTSSSSRPASIRSTSTTTSTTAHVGVGSKLTQQASPSAVMAFAGAGGPTPGAMFPVSFAALSSSSHGKARNGSVTATTTATRSSNSSSSAGAAVSVKNEAGNAHTGAGAGVGSGAGGVGSNAGMGMVQSQSQTQGQTPAPAAAAAAAIAKKTSKWKLSFGKGSSSSTHSRVPLPMPVPEVPRQQQADVVLDISGDSGKFKPNAANDAVIAVVENADEDGYENDYDKEGGADADARRQSTSAHAKADAISSEGSAQQHGASSASSTASRVKSVLMSLDADLNSSSSAAAATTTGMNHFRMASGNSNANGAEPWSRGRRPAGNQHQARLWDVSSSSSNESRWPAVDRERNVSPNSTRTGRSANLSPHSSSTSNGGVLSSSASSLSSSSNANNNSKNNWRYSTLTTSSATSGWTRYSGSNASMRSVSTVATSVSGASGTGSWRNGAGNVNRSDASLASGGEGRKPGHYTAPGGSGGGPGSIASRKSDKSSLGGMPPPNVKIMTGVPWALDELPRQLHPNPSGDIFGMPPTARKQRVRKPKDLPTISERPNQAHTHNQTHNHHNNNNNFNSSSAQQQQHPYNNSGSRVPPNKSPLSQRVDAARSSTSLHRSSGDGVVGVNEFGEPVVREGRESDEREREREREGAAPRKVQKGQINALAKMLSALRR